MPQVYNLDDGVNEYIDFTIFGVAYRFKHLNSDEMAEFSSMEGKDKGDANKFLYQYITKVDPESPDFEVMAKRMIAPHWIKFREMFKSEYSE